MKSVSFNYAVPYPSQEIELNVVRFKDSFEGDLYTISHRGTITEVLIDFIDQIKHNIDNNFSFKNKSNITSNGNEFIIQIDNKFMVQIMFTRVPTAEQFFSKTQANVVIYVFGDKNNVTLFWNKFLSKIKPSRNPVVWWNYLKKGERQATDIFLQPARELHTELYPWLNGETPKSYIQRYLDSDASVIILRGEPGTGKTSFIQNLIWQSESNAMLTYDPELFKSDEIFVEFITNKETNLLIMEDADVMLTSRVQTSNEAMAKFLNVADGIVHFANKKLVISANVVGNDKIDSALMRPGRCFDAPVFDRLTYQQTLRAAEKLNLKTNFENKTHSLAEMFSKAKGGPAESPKSNYNIGFTN